MPRGSLGGPPQKLGTRSPEEMEKLPQRRGFLKETPGQVAQRTFQNTVTRRRVVSMRFCGVNTPACEHRPPAAPPLSLHF